MELDERLVEHVAKTARLELTIEEKNEFLPQLQEILDAFSKIKEVDTINVLPSYHPVTIKNVMREDNIGCSLPQEQALSLTKHKKGGYFKGPKVV